VRAATGFTSAAVEAPRRRRRRGSAGRRARAEVGGNGGRRRRNGLEEAVAYAGRGRGARKRPSRGGRSLGGTRQSAGGDARARGLTNADIGKAHVHHHRHGPRRTSTASRKLGDHPRLELAVRARAALTKIGTSGSPQTNRPTTLAAHQGGPMRTALPPTGRHRHHRRPRRPPCRQPPRGLFSSSAPTPGREGGSHQALPPGPRGRARRSGTGSHFTSELRDLKGRKLGDAAGTACCCGNVRTTDDK